MGQLVFQATLGGQVNLVGPNTASTFNLNVPATSSTLATLTGTETFTNKTLTTPVISTISNTGTITLPTSTDTLVGRATTDTLTNKTLTTPVISSLSSASATALTLQSAGTTAVTIDTSQQVGIGTASPSNPLHVVGSIRTSSGANFAQFSNNFLRSNATGSFFYDNATVGQSNEFRTSVSSSLDTTALTLTASGILALRNAGTSATGIGITFPATQSASSDANTLDDYEEGTWTPTWVGSVSNPTQSGAPACGYVKVGRLVTVFGDFYCTSLSGGSGNLSIGGLPFTVANTAIAYSGFSLGLTNLFTATAAPRVGFTNINTTNVNLYTASSSDARTNYITAVTVSGCGLTAFSEIYFNFSYLASA